jgi:MATE family multidrug resistance protein
LEKLGIYLQSAVVVLSLASVPILLVNWHAEDLLLYSGQPALAAASAGAFSRITMWGIPFLFLYELLKKVMQAQNIVVPMAFIAFLGIVANFVTGYFFTFYTSWGYLGAAWGFVIGNMTLPLSMIPYLYWDQAKTQLWWPGFLFHEARDHIPIFLSLGVPSMVMLCTSWWAFSLLAILAGRLPNGIEAESINSVAGNLISLLFMLFLSISVSANVRIGNALGANQPERAKMIAFIALKAGFVVACSLAVFDILFRRQLPQLFIHDAAVTEYDGNDPRPLNIVLLISAYD